jgi:hypothetical protein
MNSNTLLVLQLISFIYVPNTNEALPLSSLSNIIIQHPFQQPILRFLLDSSITDFEALAILGPNVFPLGDVKPDPVLPDDCLNVHLLRSRLKRHFPSLVRYESVEDLELELGNLGCFSMASSFSNADSLSGAV